jgi:ADP-ribose pyrophosphatase
MANESKANFPAISVTKVGDRTATSRCDEGFVRISRPTLKLTYPDGTESSPFPYDIAYRVNLDAVTVVAYYRDEQGTVHVYLRSAFRPPAALRPKEVWAVPEKETLGHLWELPAGLVEADERTEEGLKTCAARELEEEVGFNVPIETVHPLGQSMFPTPGLIGERIFFFEVIVDPSKQGTPSEDGSALEKEASIVDLTLEEALQWVRDGKIEDMKTEIGLRRLAEKL